MTHWLKSLRSIRAGAAPWIACVLVFSTVAIVRPTRVDPADVRGMRILAETIEALHGACREFHADTGEYAFEYTNYPPSSRALSTVQDIEGWQGPYLDSPLSHRDSNPFGSLHLYRELNANDWLKGFDLDGDGKVEQRGAGNMLWLSGIQPTIARWLNVWLDPGDEKAWRKRGRLRYDQRRGYCWILLHR